MKRIPFSVYLFGILRLLPLARLALSRPSRLRSAVGALAACAVMGMLAVPGSALAASVTYQLASVDVDLNDSGLGLKLFADTSVLDTSSFTLDDFQSKTLSAFKIGTKELKVGLDDFFAKPITATFTFAMPGDAGAVISGKSFGTLSFFGGIGVVKWGLPDLVFTSAATFLVSLTDAKFGTPGKDLVHVKIKQLKSKAPAPVPEPASVALFLIGGTIVGLGIRRSRARIEN